LAAISAFTKKSRRGAIPIFKESGALRYETLPFDKACHQAPPEREPPNDRPVGASIKNKRFSDTFGKAPGGHVVFRRPQPAARDDTFRAGECCLEAFADAAWIVADGGLKIDVDRAFRQFLGKKTGIGVEDGPHKKLSADGKYFCSHSNSP
jgi:hypothetical protein